MAGEEVDGHEGDGSFMVTRSRGGERNKIGCKVDLQMWRREAEEVYFRWRLLSSGSRREITTGKSVAEINFCHLLAATVCRLVYLTL